MERGTFGAVEIDEGVIPAIREGAVRDDIGKVIEEALMERKKDKEDAAHKKEEDEKRKVDTAVEEAK